MVVLDARDRLRLLRNTAIGESELDVRLTEGLSLIGPTRPLDTLAADAFHGYIVRKDLVRQFSGQYPVPTYVVEFLLGRYCATTDEQEIEEGLEIVQRQLQDRTVRAGEEELFKSRAREQRRGQAHRHRHRAAGRKTDSLPGDAAQPAPEGRADRATTWSRSNERMLTGGFYAEVDARLRRDHRPGEERPAVRRSRPAADPAFHARRPGHACAEGRRALHHGGVEGLPAAQRRPGARARSPSARRTCCCCAWSRSSSATTTWSSSARAAPARATCSSRSRPTRTCLGRQGDGRAHVRQHRERPARPGVPVRRGLLRRGVRRLLRPEGRRQHHEGLHGVAASSPAARRASAPRAASSWSATSTWTCEHQQRVGHLFGPLPPEMRNDTAFMDRIHAYLPGWDIPKLDRDAVHRPLRPGQRLPVGVLDPAARRTAGSACCRAGSTSAAR